MGERVHERTEQWRNNTNSRLLREIKDPSTLHEAFQFLVKVCIEQKDIEAELIQGPSKDACGDTGEYPPYLNDKWWYDY